jgi:hypothetical protein
VFSPNTISAIQSLAVFDRLMESRVWILLRTCILFSLLVYFVGFDGPIPQSLIHWIETSLSLIKTVQGRGEVAPVLFLTEHHAMKAYWGSGDIAPLILDLGTRGRWVVSLMSPGRAPGTNWLGGWVGPRAGLNAVVKKKILSPCRDPNPRSSSPQRSAISLISPAP